MKKILLIILMLATPLFAVEPDEILDDPALETRAREISKGLRCLVCRNENIDESNAGLARDLRLLVRERLVEGDSNDATVQYIVDRFGDYVLLKPRFGGINMMLWFSGPLLLIIGGALALSFIRRKESDLEDDILSESEQARISDLIGK